MRNLAMAVSATLTAVLIGLLVANVASAARAAEIEHSKIAQIAGIESSQGAADTAAQLSAYQQRYAEAYQQLAVAYNALVQRDAQYREALRRSERTGSDLATANAALEAQLAQAYQTLQDAQSAIWAWQPASAGAAPEQIVAAPSQPNSAPVAGIANPVASRPAPAAAPLAPAAAPAAPAAAPAAPAPAIAAAQYCHYDANREWHCEDHPW